MSQLLNLPVLDLLSSCRNLLIAGMGGGFDIFCGLPIYFELQRRGQKAHLANFSFSNIVRHKTGVRLTETLVGVTAEHKGPVVNFSEIYLAQWLREVHGEEAVIWCFHKTGVQPLLANYRLLVEHLAIDGILLVDGGVDSLMRGDEAEMGTVVEDSVSLAVVNELGQIPVRQIACIGFGAEQDVSYAHVLQNMAALAQAGQFLGSCSLVRQMEAYRLYEEALLFVHDQRLQDPSVINASVISAVQGQFGNYHLTDKTKSSRLWISPFMPIYWFFDLPAVAERNLFLEDLRTTDTFSEALRATLMARARMRVRDAARIPLR
jgi:hypothetical protein